MSRIGQFLRWFSFGLIVAAIVLLVVALYRDPGLLLLRWADVEVQSTLAFLVLALLALAALWWLFDAILRRLPRLMLKRKHTRLRGALHAGLKAMAEGRMASAKKQLLHASTLPEQRALALFAAAYAADALDDVELARELLGGLQHTGFAAAAQVHAAWLGARRGHEPDLEKLRALTEGEAAPAALRALVRALKAQGKMAEAQALLGKLAASKALNSHELKQQDLESLAAALQQADTEAFLEQMWREASKEQTRDPRVIAAYVRRALALGQAERASEVLHRALRGERSAELYELYGEIDHSDAGGALVRAEAWLREEPESPSLLLALARMCKRSGQFEKAERYVRKALEHSKDAAAFEELGLLAESRGDLKLAKQAFHNALRSLRGETASALPKVSDEIATEERSDFGVPTLRQ